MIPRNAKNVLGLFDWILPQAWRQRRAPDPDLNDAVLSRLSDNDPVYRLIMDHARVNFEKWTMAALEPSISDELRRYLAGQAMGMFQLLQGIENTRAVLKEQLRKQELAMAEKAKHAARRPSAGIYPPAPGASL